MKTKNIVLLTTTAFVGGYVVARKFGDKVAEVVNDKVIKPVKEAIEEAKAEIATEKTPAPTEEPANENK